MAETLIIKHAGKIGAGLAALAGIATGLKEYVDAYGAKNALADYWSCIVSGPVKDATDTVIGTKPAEISRLWTTEGPWNPLTYLKYKFLGLDPTTGKYVGSAWVFPFWASLAVFIGAKVACYFGVAPGIAKPIEGISKGALIISTIGVLALPGSDGLAKVIANGVTEALTLS